MHFSSENYDKTHPKILKALISSNNGFVPSFGEDEYTFKAIKEFKKLFGTKEIEVFFCFNGTGANNFAISSLTERHNSILCSDVSHLYTAESTSPEALSGCRLSPIRSVNGKIVIAELLSKIKPKKDLHLPPVGVLTITQPTECGTIYDREELKTIAKHCRENNIFLHIDGARLFNALVAMDCSPAEFIRISGVDALTVGGTKSGLMFGEAVVFFNSNRFKNLKYYHKRSMQLASKNRFIAAQYSALFKERLWEQIARHTNDLASYFERELARITDLKADYPVDTNMIFMKMEQVQYNKMRTASHFYMWSTELNQVRIALSFSNTKKEVQLFLKKYKEVIHLHQPPHHQSRSKLE